MNTNIIIPARKGSKGLPKKNQILLDYTLSKIPIKYHANTYITTDDDVIINKIKNKYPNCVAHLRSDRSAIDTASTKECIEEVINDFSLKGDIVMLYLTYPDRQWQTIVEAYDWFINKKAASLLCREPIQSHPYLCMYEEENNKGKQIVEHNLCRRQDYPKCFRLCHVISIFKVEEFKKLNKNLYNNDTVYYKINSVIDVDTPDDLRKFLNNVG
jgi:CMP-N-acetylneuraminic acid synthetase